MGLNWILQDKIKEGYLPEYKELIIKYNLVKDDIELLKIKTRLRELIISPHEVAECKRIGIDIEATEFLRNELKNFGVQNPESKNTQLYSKPEDIESAILKHHGLYVESLVPDYKRNALADYYSLDEGCLHFKGSMIGNNYVIPYIFRDEAFQDHSPTEMLRYAVELSKFMDENNELDYNNNEVVKSAIKWLTFWGSNGFSFRAKY
jgi:hypothetical protein